MLGSGSEAQALSRAFRHELQLVTSMQIWYIGCAAESLARQLVDLVHSISSFYREF